ncbi:selenium-dependent molybdenum cofactor biosynthesis protein YqeB [Vibrio sp. WXL103]|uniref:selenium-dependent molybdenum cofactor biosynthesis protein YqeB n=1 Tax=Vibrio sp. WXL103 TaxID=3450710 RepID=UPI003EC4B4DE
MQNSPQPTRPHHSPLCDQLVVIRGAGDIATGVAVKLHNCGFPVIMTEIAEPTMIRCSVSLGQCLYDGVTEVETVTAVKVTDSQSALEALAKGQIAVLVDPHLTLSQTLKPHYVIDAILAKRNLGLTRSHAPITIALGPGFHAGKDCDAVIETNRGHYLGRIIYQGPSQANTGVPGTIAGFSHERVMRAPCDGIMRGLVKLGDVVTQGTTIAMIDDTPVTAPLSGMVRGLLNTGLSVTQGLKIGDIDPRGEKADHTTISDKARAIGGGVLEAMLHLDRHHT